jgi:hypothetical protein
MLGFALSNPVSPPWRAAAAAAAAGTHAVAQAHSDAGMARERYPSGIDWVVWQATEARATVRPSVSSLSLSKQGRRERELLFVMLLVAYFETYGAERLFPYRSLDEMCKAHIAYTDFRSRSQVWRTSIVRTLERQEQCSVAGTRRQGASVYCFRSS